MESSVSPARHSSELNELERKVREEFEERVKGGEERIKILEGDCERLRGEEEGKLRAEERVKGLKRERGAVDIIVKWGAEEIVAEEEIEMGGETSNKNTPTVTVTSTPFPPPPPPNMVKSSPHLLPLPLRWHRRHLHAFPLFG